MGAMLLFGWPIIPKPPAAHFSENPLRYLLSHPYSQEPIPALPLIGSEPSSLIEEMKTSQSEADQGASLWNVVGKVNNTGRGKIIGALGPQSSGRLFQGGRLSDK